MTLELVDLAVDAGGRRIVEGVNLSVANGETVGLLGPNGSGKSTILKAIYRANRPAAGRVLVDGADLLAMPANAAAQRVAAVPQDGHVEFSFTVWEMVMIGRTPHKRAFARDTGDDFDAVAEALGRVGCARLAGRLYSTLSGGEQQRVLIARALAQGADHLVLDEPTSHLDIRYQIDILDLVAGLGLSVLAALHDLSHAALYCDTVHLLSEGRVALSGPPAEVITADTVRHTYGADVLIVEHPDTGTPHLIPRRPQPPKGPS